MNLRGKFSLLKTRKENSKPLPQTILSLSDGCGFFAGFYMPSAIATLTGVTSQEHWVRALAVHELGPNLGFITVPLLAKALLKFFSWRESLALVGVACVLMGFLFLIFGRGENTKETPLAFNP